jgi:hypothetical protein
MGMSNGGSDGQCETKSGFRYEDQGFMAAAALAMAVCLPESL